MSAAASKPKGMTLKDVMCDYCDKNIRDCMCVTAPTHSRYCDTCGRARPYCVCADGLCDGGCDKKADACACPKCRTCTLRVDKCVCPCKDCKYPMNACRCYEGYEEPHPDTLCCPRCYSDPCECEARGRQQDLNRATDYDCSHCGEHFKYCQCKPAPRYDSDDD